MNTVTILSGQISDLNVSILSQQAKYKADRLAEGKEVDDYDLRHIGDDERKAIRELQFCLQCLSLRKALNLVYDVNRE